MDSRRRDALLPWQHVRAGTAMCDGVGEADYLAWLERAAEYAVGCAARMCVKDQHATGWALPVDLTALEQFLSRLQRESREL